MVDDRLTVIDLFCGIGGMSQGFAQAGYDVLFANDVEKEQIDTFCLNHPDTLASTQDINDLAVEDVLQQARIRRGQLDVLVGGPPCQGFSTYGQRRESDPRNQLFRQFVRMVWGLQPRVFVMENVVGLLSMEKGAIVSEILKTFREEIGYTTTVMVLDAANYGVPQYRRRVFFVGSREGFLPSFPVPTHTPNTESSRRVKSAWTSNKPAQQLSFFLNSDCAFPQIHNQYEGANSPSHHEAVRHHSLTVRDAISDLPAVAFEPRQSSETMPYPGDAHTEYQRIMRHGSKDVRNHAAKRHMLRRMIRTALIDQGDYGTVVRSRLVERGIPSEVVERIVNGTFAETDLRTIRDIDKVVERQLLHKIKDGRISTDNIENDITSKGFANKYRRLHWNEPSHTLVAHMARDCSDFIHPELNRPITVREAACLQSFPDTFQFGSSHFRQLRGIGNAVPPLLAYALANHIAEKILRPVEQSPVTRAIAQLAAE